MYGKKEKMCMGSQVPVFQKSLDVDVMVVGVYEHANKLPGGRG